MHDHERDQVIRNCGNPWSGRCPSEVGAVRAWQKPGPGQMLRMLADAAPAIRPAAAALMRQLARQPWRIGAIAPAVGGADPHGPQISLWVGACRIQLDCRETPQLQLVSLGA